MTLWFTLSVIVWVTTLSAQTPAEKPHKNPPVHTLTGDIRTIGSFTSRYLPTVRDLMIYLPPGYDDPKNSRKRYPVLYMHDGQNVFDAATSGISGHEWQADETAERLIKEGKVVPLIIVAIPNAGNERANEYLPTRDLRFGNGAGGMAYQYGQMLTTEIKPLIDKTYRTLPDANHTGVGGSSFGGVLTAYLGLTRPETFGKIAVVSPSVWWDKKVLLRFANETNTAPKNLRIWLDIGTKEGSKSVPDARELRDALTAKGWELDKNLKYTEAEGAEHTETAWAARFPDMLTFLFPKEEK